MYSTEVALRLQAWAQEHMTRPPADWKPCEEHDWNSMNFAEMTWSCGKCGITIRNYDWR